LNIKIIVKHCKYSKASSITYLSELFTTKPDKKKLTFFFQTALRNQPEVAATLGLIVNTG